MRIEQVEVVPYSVALRDPWVTAAGTVEHRELALVRLITDGPLVGLGEAAPFELYDGVSLGRVAAELRGPVARVLEGRPLPGGHELEGLLRHCRDAAETPQGLAAADLALHDLAARAEGVSVAELLGGARRDRIAVNASLGALEPEQAAERAGRLAAEGYGALKLKVGDAEDEPRVAAVRGALGPGPLLRLDANGAWSPPEAIAALGRLAPHDIELVEQPVPGGDLEGLAQVRAGCAIPVAADEGVASPAEAERAVVAGACDLVSVKLTSSGGIAGARATVEAARRAGGDAYLSSTLDGPLGIAAALHLAAALGIERHCGLATLDLLEGEGRWEPLATAAGELALPRGPGLGIEIDSERIRASKLD